MTLTLFVAVVLLAIAALAAVKRHNARPRPEALPARDPLTELQAAPLRLFGRDAETEALTTADARVLVVHGPSGVGKSALLRKAAELDERLASAPVAIPHRPAALQSSLLSALGLALADHLEAEGNARRAASLLAEAVQRMADQKARDLAGAALKVGFGLIADRLGDTASGLIRDLMTQLQSSASEQLSTRIEAAADPDVMRVFLTLAEATRQAVGRPVVLSLDTAERLHEDDVRRLLDLVEELPEQVHLRLALATSAPGIKDWVDRLVVVGASQVEVIGLSEVAVREWLNAVEVPAEDFAEKVLRVTDGYPTLIVAAIEHIRSGHDLADLPVAEAFTVHSSKYSMAWTRSTNFWCRLSSPLRTHPNKTSLNCC